jgi:HAD superfamily hydrolase (TIGR01484 family)
MALFKRLVQREQIFLAFVTGRHRRLVEQAIVDYVLPRPDFVIADVGTTIYQVSDAGWQIWEQWDAVIGADWQNLAHDDLHLLLSVFPMLTLQEPEKQNRHKLSYYVPLNYDSQELIGEVGERLINSGISSNLIWSMDEHTGIGLLDVLPASASKLHAIRFLMNALGFENQNTIFAGDSGNDLDVLLSDIPAVLVANADTETKARATNADPKSLIIAKGSMSGMNGNYSAGILEGVAHYWPEARSWLAEDRELER